MGLIHLGDDKNAGGASSMGLPGPIHQPGRSSEWRGPLHRPSSLKEAALLVHLWFAQYHEGFWPVSQDQEIPQNEPESQWSEPNLPQRHN